jgi:hypothetical protein
VDLLDEVGYSAGRAEEAQRGYTALIEILSRPVDQDL